MARAKSNAKKLPVRWYKNHPMAQGKGFGIVLNEKRDQWVVVNVLAGSPAEKAKVRRGDVLRRVDDYDLNSGGMLKFLRAVRGNAKRTRQLSIFRKGKGDQPLPIVPVTMLRILDRHRLLTGGLFGETGGGCHTCNLCRPSITGFASCGLSLPDPITGRRCSGRCMIA